MTTPPASAKSGSRRANALPSEHLLDEYQIDSILGAGGFGVTYKALDTHLQSWVAIKEYFPVEWSFRDADGVSVHPNTQGLSSAAGAQISDYEWGLERFLDEARVLARIQHPYVVRVKRYFRANGTAYIVMDYEEGAPLSAILGECETLGEDEVRGLLEDVLPALQAVHEQGYLHRDIKPANLYVRAHDHRVMLIDFGAARAAISHHSQAVTSLVTPGYSPPEQYTSRNDRYGTWTDMYALGAVLYRCVTGHTPAEAAERLLGNSQESAVVAGAGRYSTNLLRAIDRALAVRPEMRFQGVAEMQIALAGSREEDDDATVIMAPVSRTIKPTEVPAARSITRPPPTTGPVTQLGLGTDHHWLKTGLPTAEPHPAVSPPQETLVVPTARTHPQRRVRVALLAGGGLAVAALAVVWLWPAAPISEPPTLPVSSVHSRGQPTPPPVSGIVQSPPVIVPASQPSPQESVPPPAAPEPPPVVETAPVEPPPVVETTSAAPPPAVTNAETATPLLNPEAPKAEPAPFQEESAQPLAPTTTPASPVPIPARTLAPRTRGGAEPQPAVTTERAVTKPQITPQAPVRVVEKPSRSHVNRARNRRDRTRPQPIVVTPGPVRSPPAAGSSNPWDSPSTGFNNK